MLQGYFRAKTNSPAGLLTKAEDSIAKARVMATKLKGFGTPLHEIPSGKSLMDVKENFILEKYKEHLGEVGFLSFLICPICPLNIHFYYLFPTIFRKSLQITWRMTTS